MRGAAAWEKFRIFFGGERNRSGGGRGRSGEWWKVRSRGNLEVPWSCNLYGAIGTCDNDVADVQTNDDLLYFLIEWRPKPQNTMRSLAKYCEYDLVDLGEETSQLPIRLCFTTTLAQDMSEFPPKND